MKKFFTPVFALAMSAAPAFAHPGDHAFSITQSFLHLLTEPDHLAMLAVAAVGVAVVAKLARKRKA
jgi:hydrogenase/urease accessory protein HupE